MDKLANREKLKEWSPVILRLIIGIGFMAHGWAKFERGPDKFAALLSWMHVPFPHLMAWVVTLLELLGGFAMFVGAFVMLISIPLIAIHIVAIIGIHWKFGFSSVHTIGLTQSGPQFGPPGFEINLLYIAGIVAILLSGESGAWSIDRLRKQKRLQSEQ